MLIASPNAPDTLGRPRTWARSLTGGVPLLGLLVGLSGCIEYADPQVPCGARDLRGDGPPPWISASEAPVVALSAPDEPVVLHPVCGPSGSCRIYESRLAHGEVGPPLAAGSPVLVTPAGGYVVAIDAEDGTLASWGLDGASLTYSDDSPSGPAPVTTLVAGLRRSDSVLVRDADANLYRFDPGAPVLWPLAEARSFVRAVGERHVVTFHVVDGHTQDLFVIDAFDEFAEERPLLRARDVRQVLLTPGDGAVVISAGEGSGAETFVLRLPGPDADDPAPELVDRFAGSVASARAADDELSGLSAASPDGTRLAYVTPGGSVALRDPAQGASCLVRTGSGGAHRLVGFAASGHLFLEAMEPDATGREAPRVRVWDPVTRTQWALGAEPGVQLAAAPARPGGDGVPWSIGVQDGVYHGLQPGLPAHPLPSGHTSFLARDSSALWTVRSKRAPGPDIPARRDLELRPLAPSDDPADPFGAVSASLPHTFAADPGDDPAAALAPGADASAADLQEPVDLGPFRRTLPASTYMCVSSGTPGSWAYRCGQASDRGLLQGLARPPSESPRDRTPPQ